MPHQAKFYNIYLDNDVEDKVVNFYATPNKYGGGVTLAELDVMFRLTFETLPRMVALVTPWGYIPLSHLRSGRDPVSNDTVFIRNKP